MKKVFKMIDLDCANCAAKMETAIKKIPGVNDATVSFLAQGGDTYYSFAEAASINYRSIGFVDYEALKYYLQDEMGGAVSDAYAQVQDRVTVITG